MERETRFIPVEDAEVRVEGEAKGIRGTAAVFNRGTVIAGRFEERIAPGAFDDALASSDVRGLFNHDPNYPLGRTSAGTMTLRADDEALHYEIPDLPKSRADVLEAIERKDVTGNSFSFTVAKDGDEWVQRSDEKKLPLRTIKRFAKIHDVGPVTFPAYEHTKVSARAEEQAREMTEAEAEQLANAQGEADAQAAAQREREAERLRLAEAEA